MTQTIFTGLGGVDDVTVTVTVPDGADASAVDVALGTYDATSGDWLTPHTATLAGSTVTATLRVGPGGQVNPAAGKWWAWYRVNAPDGRVLIAPVRAQSFTVNTDPPADIDGGTPGSGGLVSIDGGTP